MYCYVIQAPVVLADTSVLLCNTRPCCTLLIDDHLYSAILHSLEQTHCARLWFYMSDKLFIARFFEYPPKWCTYSAGMAGAT